MTDLKYAPKNPFLLFATLTLGLLTPPYLLADSLAFDKKLAKHISFEGIPKTSYTEKSGIITMGVKSSSSVLIQPLDQIKTISDFSLEWQSEGELKVASAKEEESKAGDDFRLRVGLIMSGPKPFVPFFAPAWIKAVGDTLKLPSDKMVYYIAGSNHRPGEQWESPYTDSIENVALACSDAKQSWSSCSHSFRTPAKIVGIWIMADGDNSKSSFVTRIRNLVFHLSKS